MDNDRPSLIILCLGNPLLLKGRKRGQNRPSNPCCIISLQRSNNFDLEPGGSQSDYFSIKSFLDAWEHCIPTTEDNVAEIITADIGVTFHYGLEHKFMDAWQLLVV